MRILMLSPIPIYPINVGDRVRIWHMANGLAHHHELTLIVPDDGYLRKGGDPKFTSPRLRLVPTPWLPPRKVRKLKSLLSAWPYHVALRYQPNILPIMQQLRAADDYDLVYCHQLYTLPYAVDTDLPVLWDQQNVDRMYWQNKVAAYHNRPIHRIIAHWNLTKIIRFENQMLPKASSIVTVSEADRQTTQQLLNAKQPCFVAPNGVDLERYPLRAAQAETSKLVLGFFGSLDLELNQNAARMLIQQILPAVVQQLPEREVSLLLIGRNPSLKLIDLAARNPRLRITLTGTIDDVLPHLHQVDIMVLPLQSGAGTKLRVVEAMAAGICVVGSEFALMGLDGVRPGEHCRLAKEPIHFITAICQLARNPLLRRQIALAARKLIEERYSWQQITNELADKLDSIYGKNLCHKKISDHLSTLLS